MVKNLICKNTVQLIINFFYEKFSYSMRTLKAINYTSAIRKYRGIKDLSNIGMENIHGQTGFKHLMKISYTNGK